MDSKPELKYASLFLCLHTQVEKTVWDWELMNDIKPIWQRPSKEVEEDEYKAFYKTFSKVSCKLQNFSEAVGLLQYFIFFVV